MQASQAEEYSAEQYFADSSYSDNSRYECNEKSYSKSKFDYKSHYVTSFRFTLPEINCSSQSSRSLFETVKTSSE